MRSRVAVISMLAAMVFGGAIARAATVLDVTLRVTPPRYPVTDEGETIDPPLNRDLFHAVKHFILTQGWRETYCNAFNDNPTYRLGARFYHLNPDTGQENIDCDPEKSDFNTLVIRHTDRGRDSYRWIQLEKEDRWLYITVSRPADATNVGEIRDKAVEALIAITKEMDRLGYEPPPNPPDDPDGIGPPRK